MMNAYTLVVSLLCGMGLFAIYYNLRYINKSSNESLKTALLNKDNNKDNNNKNKENINNKNKIKTKTNLENEHDLENERELAKYQISNIKYSDKRDLEVDNTQLFRKIDNSKYEKPIDKNLVCDPRIKNKNTL